MTVWKCACAWTWLSTRAGKNAIMCADTVFSSCDPDGPRAHWFSPLLYRSQMLRFMCVGFLISLRPKFFCYFSCKSNKKRKLLKHCSRTWTFKSNKMAENKQIKCKIKITNLFALLSSQGNFGGRCMLYGLVNYNSSAGLIRVQSSSAPSLCYFVSAISVLVAVVCFSMSVYWLYTLCMDGEIRR